MIYSYNWGDPQNDTRLFLNKLWNVEHYDMWHIKECAAIAYLLDNLYKWRSKDEYTSIVEDLFLSATNITWNEFSFMVAYKTNELIDKDEPIELIDLKRARQRYDQVISDCKLRKATSFWMLDEKYAPAWFHEMMPTIIEHQESKMKERFVAHFSQLNWKDEDAEYWYRSFKNQDPMLLHELDQCLKHKRYKTAFCLVYQERDGAYITANMLSKEYKDEPIISIYIKMFMLRH